MLYDESIVSKKESIIFCEGGIENSIGMPRDAKRWSLGWNFLFHPHTHDSFIHTILRISSVAIVLKKVGCIHDYFIMFYP